MTKKLLHLLTQAPYSDYLDGRAFDFQGADAAETEVRGLRGAGFVRPSTCATFAWNR